MSIEKIKLLMRDNYESIGFIPMTRIEKQFEKGLVFNQVDNGEWVGYLIIGAIQANRTVYIWQECIDKSARGYGSGRRLFERLLKKCKESFVHQIILRCAEDLESNVFWKSMGFEFVKSAEPNNRRKRRINIYRMIVTEDLFNHLTPSK